MIALLAMIEAGRALTMVTTRTIAFVIIAVASLPREASTAYTASPTHTRLKATGPDQNRRDILRKSAAAVCVLTIASAPLALADDEDPPPPVEAIRAH